MKAWQIIVFLCTFLSGCGFIPRNYQVGNYCAQLNYRSKPQYTTFGIKLREALLRTGVTFLEEENAHKPCLEISSKREFNTDRVAASTEARVYKVNLTATVKLFSPKGNLLLPELHLRTERSIMLRPHESIALTPQSDMAEESAATELVNLAMEKLFTNASWNLTSSHES